ncbi:MAG TPA: hemerythrin domain-containing protein [Bacteroidia bacterium]|nr:hemerythrin domain-containing protein [Bacteroidia bacterium]
MKRSIATGMQEYSKLNPVELKEVIVSKFHETIRDTIGMAETQLAAAGKIEKTEEVEVVMNFLEKLKHSFEQHAMREERLLFPLLSLESREEAIREIEEIGTFISELKKEHENMERELDLIKMATNNYQCDPMASPSHKLAYAHLNDVGQDFRRMFFIEEEFLFPRILRFNLKKQK